METKVKTPWFKEGLKFKCTGCGGCCTGSPGYVFLTETDLDLLAKAHNLSRSEFTKKYCSYVDGKYSLLEKNGRAYDCIFLTDNKCSVYEVRPVQCRTFPWWIENLKSEKGWKEAATRCEGINHPDAELIPSTHIEKECTTYLDSLLEQNFNL